MQTKNKYPFSPKFSHVRYINSHSFVLQIYIVHVFARKSRCSTGKFNFGLIRFMNNLNCCQIDTCSLVLKWKCQLIFNQNFEWISLKHATVYSAKVKMSAQHTVSSNFDYQILIFDRFAWCDWHELRAVSLMVGLMASAVSLATTFDYYLIKC